MSTIVVFRATELKGIQQLLSFSAVEILYSAEATNKKGKEAFVFDCFHGKSGDKDNISLVEKLVTSVERFKPLFDDAGLVKQCFGSISNLPLASLGIEGAHLHEATFGQSKWKTGDIILQDGMSALKHLKKYLALWRQCQYSDGKFHSGKTEESALLYVRQQFFKEVNNVVCVDMDEEKEEEGKEQEGKQDDDGKDSNSKPMPATYYPPFFSSFVLNGPYCKIFGLEPSPILTVDSKWLDGHKEGRQKKREKVKKEKDSERHITKDRGAPSAARKQEVIDMTLTTTMQSQASVNRIQKQIDTCLMMINMAVTEAETQLWRKQLRIHAVEMCDNNNFVQITNDIPPLLAKTAIRASTSIPSTFPTPSSFQTPSRENDGNESDDDKDNDIDNVNGSGGNESGDDSDKNNGNVDGNGSDDDKVVVEKRQRVR
jgi:hypothetical protein